ncbi:phospholipid-translocating P-type ATPase [Choiromyces venosus 120613-1]|uniref:Phospholipid-transporting ATPase n=1 Tax=Choiromyces venosus 120613-1 TaxID=1336337 RepID=A0A3N4K421_9PEZI|nr:phospholipid-translocating P-type ATPase [Choiromyces venosus 120613-1]
MPSPTLHGSSRTRKWILSSPPVEWAMMQLQEILINALRQGPIPQHVAFVMDGNRRVQILEVCYKSGVKVVTIYAFSIENFKRPLHEVNALMEIAKIKLSQLCQHGELMDRYGASLRILGHRSLLRQDVLEAIEQATEMTRHNDKAILNVCFPYTSRDEMTTAIRDIVSSSTIPHTSPPSPSPSDSSNSSSTSTSSDKTATPGLMDIESITEKTITQHMFTSDCPPLDLLVRTSGVERLSDFMMWQCHQDTDIVFSDCLWPQFDIWKFLPILVNWGVKRRKMEKERGDVEMSNYIRASSPSPSDESSDLDLDLEELDPTNGGGGAGYSAGYRSVLGENHRSSFSPTRRGRSSVDGASGPGRIALRRMKGREAAEDEEALLGRRRRSEEEDTHDDGEPSNLRDTGGERRLLRRLGSRISLRSTTAGGDAVVDFTPSKETRVVGLRSGGAGGKYPPNIISNHKFTAFTFLPLTLWHEFSFFFNLYFLLVALSQCIPVLRIGYLSSYIVPLVFVLSITLGKEAHDDIARRRRDTEANSEPYEVLSFTDSGAPMRKKKGVRLGRKKSATEAAGQGLREGGDDEVRTVFKKSKDLKVGDILVLKKDNRVPADVVILKTISNEVNQAEEGAGNDTSGETFIRTDQLDGETDWKLRLAPALTQALHSSSLAHLTITASAPSREVNNFVGSVSYDPPAQDPTTPSTIGSSVPLDPGASSSLLSALPGTAASSSMGLSVDNTAWANTVLASNSTTLAAIIYTGPETRAALSTSRSRSKTGLLEKEINNLTKILCVLTFSLSIALVALQGFENNQNKPEIGDPESPGEVVSGSWYIKILRFLVLFSTIIPISLRVNLDMGKSAYAWFIEHDKGIEGTVVRTSTIPEELGRVEYLLSDKTGTLTQNDMELKKIHVGTVSYAGEAMDEVADYIRLGFSAAGGGNDASGGVQAPLTTHSNAATTRTRREIGSRVRDVVLALALCHNVTPTTATEEGASEPTTTYQASSPDEIAIVRWTESVGLRLSHRDRKGIKLQSVDTGEVVVRVKILEVFPFTSEGKRMGIVVQFMTGEKSEEEQDLLGGGMEEKNSNTGDVWFYQKGADTVMSSIVQANDWLDEECGNMAREGLRTLVVGRKKLSVQRYQEFSTRHKAASLLLVNRDREMGRVVEEYLEHDLELLGVTGVEDKLQKDVKPSLELLRNAGIKIWMLTGDKVETARCVAVSAKLVSRGQYVHTIAKLKRKNHAYDALEFLRNKTDFCLLIDGESLALLLDTYKTEFISLAVQLPAVIACRCTPTQKADVARLIRAFTKKRICCIGDGGNDVSMIQAADVGVGIVGKEGRQASLAADFSIEQFCHLTKLLVWHGRNSYKRSAKLAQFVMHRGLVISVCQTMFSIASRFEPIALYKGWLLVGYASLYTMAPVFSLVLDRDVDERLANLYPELYKELTEGRSLSYRTFFVWVLVSIYQGGIIQGFSQILVGLDEFKRMVSVSFTVLVLNELIMVALEITTWYSPPLLPLLALILILCRHMWMIFAELGTALFFFASIPLLGEYFDLGYVISWGFLWRVAVISAISLIPPWAVKAVRRRLKPPSYAKVQGI